MLNVFIYDLIPASEWQLLFSSIGYYNSDMSHVKAGASPLTAMIYELIELGWFKTKVDAFGYEWGKGGSHIWIHNAAGNRILMITEG